MFSMSSYKEWGRGVRNRNYYILNELLKRREVREVIMVEYLPLQWRKKLSAFLFVSFEIYKTSYRIIAKDYGGILYSVKDKLKVYTTYCMSGLCGRLKRLGATDKNENETRIIWSYFPLYANCFSELPNDIIVFDAVDDWRAHPAYRKYIKVLARNYSLIAKNSDCIFTVSEHLKNHLFYDHKNTRWIPNGVDSASIDRAPLRKKKTTIGYVGTIQSRVDFDLVCFLAKSKKDKQFVFVGPVWKDAEAHRVSACGNVIFTGPVPNNELKHYLSTFDVAIIPHKINELTTSMNPMKFYEYLAAGLPVVATQKLVSDSDLLYYAKSYDEFSEAIDRALSENTEDRARKRIEYAKENSWEKRVNEMIGIIGEIKK
ncbi:MAG: hypothetical protein UW39_C0001G0037 [Parcubacteria group bacterium GW2011_GWC2_44_17]|nr:MAG: hypothetical protein UW39_C0001G0037 [Parcubacteria group bacterium GW2011_GWC2_44_17]KKT48452.1 MAG: hypothetical protein UW40_C0043G0004 [Parcubacteria group bacterium GW2011_GWF2_44_17]